jgi:mannose-6-phosphate isomerase class I
VQPLPIRLRPDNFTPPSRTPWGGTRLLHHYKVGLGIRSVAPDALVGESWELSTSEEFHSITESGERLGTVLQRDALAFLGDEARSGRAATSLLVKWLDAGDNLSLQIHPEDDYPGLGPNEAGKLEAWYIVAHEPGAGIYLGLRPGVGEREVRDTLASGGDLSTLMAFVAAQRGDLVLLEPGTPHAVGKGVTLIEPQLVAPGLRGVTYRYWDWGRRYDERGAPDPAGRPRELHLDHALAVTRWDRAADARWLASRRAAYGWPEPSLPARCELLCAHDQAPALPSSQLRMARLCGSGPARLPPWNALRAVTVIEGEVVLGRGHDGLRVPAGCTAAVPAAAGELAVELRAAHALVTAACVGRVPGPAAESG